MIETVKQEMNLSETDITELLNRAKTVFDTSKATLT